MILHSITEGGQPLHTTQRWQGAHHAAEAATRTKHSESAYRLRVAPFVNAVLEPVLQKSLLAHLMPVRKLPLLMTVQLLGLFFCEN